MTDIGPHDPITLAEAAEMLLRGLFTASTLRAAADRGELAVELIGKRIVTTPADVAEWRKLCRAKAEGRISISNAEVTARRSGISATVEAASAQDATRAMLTALAKPSGFISPARRGRISDRVIRPKFGSPT